MGTWMATVRFPDGIEKYASYSTVVGSMHADLFATFHVEHYRELVSGDPLPKFPGVPHAPVDQLIPVEISRAPDDDRWHAVYCPRRSMVLGPLSPDAGWRVQEACELVRGAGDDLRHLSLVQGQGRCGAPVLDPPLPYRRQTATMGGCDLPAEEQPAEADIFAEWSSPDMCRECLLRAAQDR